LLDLIFQDQFSLFLMFVSK